MPLVGILCSDPAHEGLEVSFDDCISCMIKGDTGRRCEYFAAIPIAMKANNHERKDAGLSATTLLDCPRAVILKQEHDYRESPKAYYARFRGTIGHLAHEAYPPDDSFGIVQEVRFRKSVVVDGVEIEITGKPDWINVHRKMILDHKSTVSINRKPVKEGLAKENHAEQLSIYRWLVWGGTNMDTGEVVHYEIDTVGGINYFSMEAPKKVAVVLMTLEETEAFIIERVRPLVEYQKTGALPPQLVDDNGRRPWLCNLCPVREFCDSRLDVLLEEEYDG